MRFVNVFFRLFLLGASFLLERFGVLLFGVWVYLGGGVLVICDWGLLLVGGGGLGGGGGSKVLFVSQSRKG